MIRILVADDHPIVRQGLRQTLSEASDMTVAGEAGDEAEIMNQLSKKRYDVILLDISMPGRGGIDVLSQLRSSGINTPVLILSAHPEEQYAVRSIRAGAAGYLTKTCGTEELISAIRRVASGRKYISETLAERLADDVGKDVEKPPHELLSNQEFEVMRRIASGKTASEIAREMSLSVKTISTYRSRILEKMNMKSNAEVMRYCFEKGLIQ